MIVALVFVAGCLSPRPKEPSYESKRLSVWAVETSTFANQEETSAQYAAAEAIWTNVVRAVGTNGLPFYLLWLGDAPNSFRQFRGEQAIEILGPAAEPAIPTLASLLKNDEAASYAARCLSAFGPAAIPYLTEAVETLTNRGRVIAISTLAEFGSVAESVVPVLIQLIKSDSPLAWPAMQALVEIETNTDLVLPLLVSHVSDTNCASGAAYALGRLGNAGVPILLMSLTNQSRSIRCFAAGALDPQFQTYALIEVKTNAFWFQRLCTQYNLKVLQAASRSYSLGDFVAAVKAAEQYTNSINETIRESANCVLSILRPLAETNVPQMRLEEERNFIPKP